MDRAAKLAEYAKSYLEVDREFAEACGVSEQEARRGTRAQLAEDAEELGFAPNEISAAVDQALADAGTTP